MNKKLLIAALALAAASCANAGVVTGVAASSFQSAAVEHFNGAPTNADAVDFAYRMSYARLDGVANDVNYVGAYGLGDTGSTTGGLNDDGYLATGDGRTTFSFSFAGGTQRFGFHGAEASIGTEEFDGILHLDFYDIHNVFMQSVEVDTNGAFSWDTFYGFQSNGSAIGRVVFNDAAYAVLDDVAFDAVPEPGSFALLGLGLAGVAAARRRK